MRCRCIKEYDSTIKVGDIYEYNMAAPGLGLVVDVILNGKVSHYYVRGFLFNDYFVDIVEDRDNKIGELLGG